MKDAYALDVPRLQVIVVVAVIALALALLLPAVQHSREAARRSQSKNNLKQIVLAFQNYHEVHQCLPPGGTFDTRGQGYHGWPTLIWNQMEAITLPQQINYERPWDAPVNADYFRLRLDWLINPSIGEKSTSEFAPAHYSANAGLLGPNSSTKLTNIKNASNTFLVGELGADFIPWGCPYNWRPLVNLNAQPRTYGRESIGGQFAIADGSVRWITSDISPDLLDELRGPDLASDAAAT